MSWTEQAIEKLNELWATGMSCSLIASHLGSDFTRNAVIGKVHRLGLSGRVARVAAVASRPPKPRTPRATRTYAKAPVKRVPVPEPVKVAAAPRFKALVELQSGDCRWPLGDPNFADFSFCGDAVKAGSSYCEAHHQIAYTPSTNRRSGSGSNVRSTGGSPQLTPARVNF